MNRVAIKMNGYEREEGSGREGKVPEQRRRINKQGRRSIELVVGVWTESEGRRNNKKEGDQPSLNSHLSMLTVLFSSGDSFEQQHMRALFAF